MRYLRLGVVRLSDLIPHEATNPLRVKEVKYSIRNLRRVLKPVITDLRTGVVIDGHHRVEALKELGLKYVPAIMINYRELRPPKPFNYYVVGLSRGGTELLVKELIRECDGCGDSEVVIKYSLGNDSINSLIIKSDLRLIHEVLSRLLRVLNASLTKVVSSELPSNPYYVVLKPLRITHNDVTKVAYEGEPYPPKTTYHVTKLKEVLRPTEVNLLR